MIMRVVHDVGLYSVLDTVVISGDYVCCNVVFGTLIWVFVFSGMWSELLMTSAIICPQCTSAREWSAFTGLGVVCL